MTDRTTLETQNATPMAAEEWLARESLTQHDAQAPTPDDVLARLSMTVSRRAPGTVPPTPAPLPAPHQGKSGVARGTHQRRGAGRRGKR